MSRLGFSTSVSKQSIDRKRSFLRDNPEAESIRDIVTESLLKVEREIVDILSSPCPPSLFLDMVLGNGGPGQLTQLLDEYYCSDETMSDMRCAIRALSRDPQKMREVVRVGGKIGEDSANGSAYIGSFAGEKIFVVKWVHPPVSDYSIHEAATGIMGTNRLR
jgi:hypothetical protein